MGVVCLCFIFVSYTLWIDFVALKPSPVTLSPLGFNGKMAFQKHQCMSCHQIYGLGGYLGPDLTNVYLRYDKADAFLMQIIKNGGYKMPRLNLTEPEVKAVIQYLKELSQTGCYPVKPLYHQAGFVEVDQRSSCQ